MLNKYSVTVKRQSLSWIWALVVVTLGLITSAWLYTIFDNVRNPVNLASQLVGTDQGHMSLLNTFWAWTPVTMLIGWGIFVIIMSITTRGGDQYA